MNRPNHPLWRSFVVTTALCTVVSGTVVSGTAVAGTTAAAERPTAIALGTTTQHEPEFEGKWRRTGDSSSAERWSSLAGSTYELEFSGAGVVLFGTLAPWHGRATVQIDGGPATTVDQYAPTRQEDVPFYESPVLDDGDHVVLLTVLGDGRRASSGQVVTVGRSEITAPAPVAPALPLEDATTALGGPSAGTPTTTEVTTNDAVIGDGAFAFEYRGLWATSTGRPKFEGDDHYSGVGGSALTFRFTGTSVRLFGARAPQHGQATVRVDGGAPVLMDQFSPEREDDVLVFESAGLSPGPHEVTVAVAGTGGRNGKGTVISIDRAVTVVPAQPVKTATPLPVDVPLLEERFRGPDGPFVTAPRGRRQLDAGATATSEWFAEAGSVRRRSSAGQTDSDAMRMWTTRTDLGFTQAEMDVRFDGFTGASESWHGINLWMNAACGLDAGCSELQDGSPVGPSGYALDFVNHDGVVTILKKVPGDTRSRWSGALAYADGGTYYRLAGTPWAPEPGATHRFAGRVIDSGEDTATLEILVDDQVVLKATDDGSLGGPRLTGGRVGLRSDYSNFTFDDLTITRPSGDGSATAQSTDTDPVPPTRSPGAAAGAPRALFTETFDGADGVFADESDFWSGDGEPDDDWFAESGSVRRLSSTGHSRSDTMRMWTRRTDLGFTQAEMDVQFYGFTGGSEDWHGINLWMNEALCTPAPGCSRVKDGSSAGPSGYALDFVNRDGRLTILKKVPGDTRSKWAGALSYANAGTYYKLASTSWTPDRGARHRFAGRVMDSGAGRATLQVIIDGEVKLQVVDDGQVGGPRLTGGRVGIRSDYSDFKVDNFKITRP